MSTATLETTSPKVVVEWKGVDRFEQGDVVPIDSIVTNPAEQQRLLRLGAIRHANEFESGQTKVTVKGQQRQNNQVLEQQIHTLQMENAELKAQISKQTHEIVALKQGYKPVTIADDTKTVALIHEKDKRFNELEVEHRRLVDAHASLQAQHAEMSRESLPSQRPVVGADKRR